MQTEILVAIVGAGGVIIGAAIPLFWQSRDYKERYQQMAFEKRLQVHQQGYNWCNKLMESTTHIGFPYEDAVSNAKNWFSENCLYLDNDSRDSFSDLIFEVERYNETHGAYDAENREQYNDRRALGKRYVQNARNHRHGNWC